MNQGTMVKKKRKNPKNENKWALVDLAKVGVAEVCQKPNKGNLAQVSLARVGHDRSVALSAAIGTGF